MQAPLSAQSAKPISRLQAQGWQSVLAAGPVAIAGNASLSACAGISLRSFPLSRQGFPLPFLIFTRDLARAFVVLDATFEVVGLFFQQVSPLFTLTVNKGVDLCSLCGVKAGHHDADFIVAAILTVGGETSLVGKALASGFLVHRLADIAPHKLKATRFLWPLGDYAARIVSDFASRASDAEEVETSAETLATSLSDTIASRSGVNIDEETAKLSDYQALYSAAAQVIQAANEMFEALLSAAKSA